MTLSIIIPYYNGGATIEHCLDSIYSQGLNNDDYEVICIDDCSPDPASVMAIKHYHYHDTHPKNLILLSHNSNKRQGGARNTGIKAAKGEWILFVDQDDFFIENSIPKAIDIAKHNPEMDLIMFDCFWGNGQELPQKGIYSSLNQNIMTGAEFIQSQPVSWCPWCYMYHRESLLLSGLHFEENVRFEDADFVIKYIAQAKHARFIPLIIIYHVIHKKEQSYIGNDFEKINDLLKIEYRIAFAANQRRQTDWNTGQAMMNHAIVQRISSLKRYLWRLSCKDMMRTLHSNHYTIKTNNRFVDFSNNHIKTTVTLLTILKPLFYVAAAIKQIYKALS